MSWCYEFGYHHRLVGVARGGSVSRINEKEQRLCLWGGAGCQAPHQESDCQEPKPEQGLNLNQSPSPGPPSSVSFTRPPPPSPLSFLSFGLSTVFPLDEEERPLTDPPTYGLTLPSSNLSLTHLQIILSPLC